MDKSFSLPGIRKISYIPTDRLSADLSLMRAARVPIVLYGTRTDVPFVGEPTCEAESINGNKGKKQETTLDFNTTTVIPEAYAIAFVVEDNNGQAWLIGLKEEPYPSITCVKSFGTTDGDVSALHVEVKFVATEALIPIQLG